MIETVNDLVAELGGTAKAAIALNVTPQYVSKMKRIGYVPSPQIIKVQRIARRKRWSLADSLFEAEESTG